MSAIDPASDSALPVSPLPYITADLPGIGGELKTEPADFEVEEIPAYQPQGAGEHLFLWIEKTGLTTDQVVKHLVRTLRVPQRDVGVAALKDRHAITRQFFSVPAKLAERVPELEMPGVRVLKAELHQNKLRTGHLKGNRFSILLRNTHPEALERALAIAARLQVTGIPNYYGEQRFGTGGETAELGFDLLRGDQTPEDIHPAQRRYLLRLALSAAQSTLFNRLLADRLAQGEFQRVLPGDVLQVVASGGVFTSEQPETDQPRFDAREIVPAGPMYGSKMKAATGEVAAREQAMLTAYGLSADNFQRYPELTSGTRRPYVIFIDGLEITPEQAGLRFQFSLPSGCYATILLREFQKAE